MRAWQVTGINQPAVLSVLADPEPGAGQARVRVRASGLNFADLLMAEGRYQNRPDLPFIPGMELAGVVEVLGPDTQGPAPSTRVLAIPGTGALAGSVVLPVSMLVPIPDAMPFTVAAGFGIAYGTSYLALSHKARLLAGETLLVTGAAGGVGLTAVEIGKRLGARVIATARGAAKCALVAAAGADLVIDSDSPDLKDALRAAGGVDVVYDTVGGPGFDAALRATRPDGRLLVIGFASGEVPQVPANLLLVKNLTVTGFWYGGYQQHAPGVVAASMARLLDWYGEGGLRPHVSHSLPFEAFPEGLDLLRSRSATGKVVILADPA